MERRKKCWKWPVFTAAAAVLAVGWVGFLLYIGRVQLNGMAVKKYQVRGVDVSHYQGDIDWKRLAEQDIDFAYIKATEGSSHVDEKFSENWQEVRDTDLKAGAYHFFSFDSPGATQAANFTGQVEAFEGMLPPVVDFEFYGDKEQNRPEVKAATEQLQIMLDGLEAHYHVKPVIYATEEAWEAYLSQGFSDYPLWIRNVKTRPASAIPDWTFWQYSNRTKLDGYQGQEPFIDMNVFCGDRRKWEYWTQKTAEGYNYRPNWGSFGQEPQYSYDGRYVAEQDVVDDGNPRSVRVTIRDVQSGETVGSFVGDRALDFWGICWEDNNYRIWTQSGDVGLRCYRYQDGDWRYDMTAGRPESVISKYDYYSLDHPVKRKPAFLWNECRLELPDESWGRVMSGDSGAAGWTSPEGSADLYCIKRAALADELACPASKEDIAEIWNQIGPGGDAELEDFQTRTKEGADVFLAFFRTAGENGRYVGIKGIYGPETVYFSVISINGENAVQTVKTIINSFEVLGDPYIMVE